MISILEGNTYSVLVPNVEVNEFAKSFPCHGLDLDAEYLFQFDGKNGDILDITVLRDREILENPHAKENAEGLRALCEDACLVGAEQLELHELIGLRFGAYALSI